MDFSLTETISPSLSASVSKYLSGSVTSSNVITTSVSPSKYVETDCSLEEDPLTDAEILKGLILSASADDNDLSEEITYDVHYYNKIGMFYDVTFAKEDRQPTINVTILKRA